MNIQTKFNVGEKVCTIDPKTMKIREFEISTVAVVGDENSQSVSYRAKGDSYLADGYPEEKCFANKSDLLKFISTEEPKEEK